MKSMVAVVLLLVEAAAVIVGYHYLAVMPVQARLTEYQLADQVRTLTVEMAETRKLVQQHEQAFQAVAAGLQKFEERTGALAARLEAVNGALLLKQKAAAVNPEPAHD